MVAIVATFLMSHALVHAQAGKNYGITIGGVELTSGNYQNITPAGGFPAVVGGTVKFDPESYTLSLSDVSIDGGSEQGIYFTSSGKTSQFELTGTNKVVSTGSVAVGTSVDLTIKGDGTLVASASGRSSYGILVSNIKSLTIEEKTTIEAEGKFYGIGANNNKEVLTIKDQAHVTARCSNNSCVAGFGWIVLDEGLGVIKPAGAVIDGGAVKLNDQVCTGEVIIGSLEYYDILIGNVEVTSANYLNITPEGGFPAVVGGTVKFDPDTYTLTLEDAEINSNSSNGIIFRCDVPCNLMLRGKNNVSSAKPALASSNQSLTISGTEVTFKSTRDAGIYINSSNLTIDGCTVTATGVWGIAGWDGSSEILTVKNATVKAQGDEGSICDLKDLELIGCAITAPDGAVWNAEKHAVCDPMGEVITGEVVIGSLTEEYGIRIGGVEVTSDNYLNITPEGGFPVVQSGTVKYSPRSRTLTLTDAIISAEDRNQRGIEIYGNGAYNLVLEGIKTNVSANSTALLATQLTISGKQGTFKSQTDCGIYIPNASFEESRNLTIDGCTVTATGVWGIAGRDGSSEILTVKNATVKAQGESGSICDLKELELIGCVIAGPKSAVWDPEKHAICNPMGEVITSQVIIEPMGTAIGDIQANKNTAMEQGTYTMSGQRIKGDRNNLPRGIYIMKGKKVVIN